MTGSRSFLELLPPLLVFCQVFNYGLILEEETEPNYLTAGVGEYVVFNCDLDFPHETPIPYILQWNRDGHGVFSWYDEEMTLDPRYRGRIHLLEDSLSRGYGQGSINLTNIRESDQGWYECRVIFPNRTPNSRKNGTWFHLAIDGVSPLPTNVPGETLFTTPPVNKSVMEGEPVSFDCVVKDNSSTVTWFHESIEISQVKDLERRASIKENGTLVIKSTLMSDLGEYTCGVTGWNGNQQNASAFLNVQYKAKVIYAPREVYLPYGKPALLDCHFRANPPLTNLRWEKDGFLFDPYNVQGVFYRRNGSLYFSKVDETHSGSYSCTPYNDLGTEGPSPAINVVVQRPPVFTVTPQHLYMRKLGESLEIPCDASDGDQSHRPTIAWYKDGSPLPRDRTIITGGNLTIERIQEQDRGLYQCAASNEAATVVADTELMVLNIPPRAPYNLSANSSKNAVTLTWVPGYVRPKMEYSVWYRPTDMSEWRTMKILSRKITEATVNNLHPGREYEFMVLSQDKHGDGMFSKALRVFTKPTAIDQNSASEFRSPLEEEKMGPPRNVRVQATVEGYLVTWEPPSEGRGQVRLYVVRWFRGPAQHLYGRSETTDTYYLVKTLEEESQYTFEVAAMSLSDDEAISGRISLEVPAYRRNRAISMGIVAGIGFLAATLAAVWWARKRFCRTSTNEK
ncbi:protein borderless-like isoform X1 [Vespa mandarinia]|uniref:protein borderless-like isoform X1 n=1 Tax=Vespa mandarinia TaxID=7446 RepID=UPI001611B5B4|nr:protein borderless-like isoform X1 [Vespa mandarinia]XP_047359830.1 protein borderless isoform X1 [Vespa velutina]